MEDALMYYTNPHLINLERIGYQNNRKDYLRLDLNENPGGLPEHFVKELLSTVTPDFISQYPETQEFMNTLASFLEIEDKNICITNGSSEAIRHAIEAFTSEGGQIVGVTPSYAMYEVFAKMYGRQFIRVPYRNDLTISTSDIISHLNSDVQLLILLNPNNPIGNAYSNEEFEELLIAAQKYEITLLIDEAYMYFYNNTFIKYVMENEHILLTRTFSKLFSLGGLRLGYVVGQPKEIKMISNLCTPHNTNAFAMLFAQKIIETPGLLNKLIDVQLEGKAYIIEELKRNGYEINAQEGNFIFIKPRALDADLIVEKMKNEKKILIKSYSGIGKYGKCLRVTTGAMEYMKIFFDALLEIDRR